MLKFRGKDIKTGEYRYGGIYKDDNYCFIVSVEYEYETNSSYIEEFMVDPNSVAQLVGYDSNGNEVYEGDCLMTNEYDGNDSYYKPYKLKILCDMGGGIYLMGHRFTGYSLWEESK